jgi:nucleotide-binding universal stress UspA family protein
MSFATMMVHVDGERDSEQRIQFALRLADRFDAALIGVAGLPPRPAFAAGAVAVYSEPGEGRKREMAALFDGVGKKFCTQGQDLKHVEWRSCLDPPEALLAREARAADLLIVGPRHTTGNARELVDPGVILLRAGRPVLVVPRHRRTAPAAPPRGGLERHP